MSSHTPADTFKQSVDNYAKKHDIKFVRADVVVDLLIRSDPAVRDMMRGAGLNPDAVRASMAEGIEDMKASFPPDKTVAATPSPFDRKNWDKVLETTLDNLFEKYDAPTGPEMLAAVCTDPLHQHYLPREVTAPEVQEILKSADPLQARVEAALRKALTQPEVKAVVSEAVQQNSPDLAGQKRSDMWADIVKTDPNKGHAHTRGGKST